VVKDGAGQLLPPAWQVPPSYTLAAYLCPASSPSTVPDPHEGASANDSDAAVLAPGPMCTTDGPSCWPGFSSKNQSPMCPFTLTPRVLTTVTVAAGRVSTRVGDGVGRGARVGVGDGVRGAVRVGEGVGLSLGVATTRRGVGEGVALVGVALVGVAVGWS
jgi:hypothetical protein